MDFRKLLDGACGQANPVAQLATHVTQNHAHQMEQEYVNENALVPNTFNMNELMAQLQNIESPISMVPSASVSHNHYFDGSSFEENMVRLQQNINFPVCQPQAYLPSAAEYHHQFQLQPQQRPIGAEEFQRMQRDIAEAQAIINKLEEDEDVIEEQVEISKSEAESSKNMLKQPEYLEYDDLLVENVYGICDKGMNDAEKFYNFVENYVLKNSSKKYQKYFPNNQETEPAVIKKFHHIITSNIYLNDLFEKWRQSDDSCKSLREKLIEYLVSNEQYNDVMTIFNYFADYCSSNGQKKISESVFFSTDAYLHEHCFYQACQTLFDCLKNHPDYGDIVPPNFVMEDRTETTVDKEQLGALTKMFIKAAQRNPGDSDLQIAIAKLCEIDRDYEKSIDCYKSILTNDLDYEKSVYISMCLGKSFALSNKPNRALETFWRTRYDPELNITFKSSTNIGLSYLYQRHYAEAAAYLFQSVRKQIALGYEESKHVTLENSLSRLRLCFELMRRDNFCEALDNKDYVKVEELMRALFLKRFGLYMNTDIVSAS